jgi:hypothetical protein
MHLTSQCIVLLLRASLWDWRIVSPPKQMEAVTHERTGDEHVAASQTNWKHWRCAQLSSLTYSIGRIAKRLPTVLSSSLFFLSSFGCAPGIKQTVSPALSPLLRNHIPTHNCSPQPHKLLPAYPIPFSFTLPLRDLSHTTNTASQWLTTSAATPSSSPLVLLTTAPTTSPARSLSPATKPCVPMAAHMAPPSTVGQ